MLAALTTAHEFGLGTVAGLFVLFAIVCSFVLPRRRPDFPGRTGMRAFLGVCLVFFFGMVAAVEVFGGEAGEAASPQVTPVSARTTETSGIPGRALTTVAVREIEWKVSLPTTKLKTATYLFKLTNAGKIPHNLTISGPQVQDAHTATIGPGQTAEVKAALVAGTYDFYCSVPGHKGLGMDTKVTVTNVG